MEPPRTPARELEIPGLPHNYQTRARNAHGGSFLSPRAQLQDSAELRELYSSRAEPSRAQPAAALGGVRWWMVCAVVGLLVVRAALPLGPLQVDVERAKGVLSAAAATSAPAGADVVAPAAQELAAAASGAARADRPAREGLAPSPAVDAAAAADAARAADADAAAAAAAERAARAAADEAASAARAAEAVASDGGVPLADFALESAGGAVVAASPTYFAAARCKTRSGVAELRALAHAGGAGAAAVLLGALGRLPRTLAVWSRALTAGGGGLGAAVWDVNRPARNALRAGAAAGECWAAQGSRARLLVRLAARVAPSAFSIDFPPTHLRIGGDIRSAPRELRVWGVEPAAGAAGPPRALPPLEPAPGEARRVLLARHEFTPSAAGVTTFAATPGLAQPGGGGLFGGRRGAAAAAATFFEFVELEIASNHGHPDYTALYRFRVHGERAAPASART